MEQILLDGNNVLQTLGLVRGGDLSRAERFLQDLERAALSNEWEVIAVFDGPQRFLRRDSGPLVVRYAPRGQTADTVIERFVYQAADRSLLVVVTRDRAQANLVLGLGARVWTPERLQEEMAVRE